MKEYTKAILVLATAMLWNERANASYTNITLKEYKPDKKYQQTDNKLTIGNNANFVTFGLNETPGATFADTIKTDDDHSVMLPRIWAGFRDEESATAEDMTNMVYVNQKKLIDFEIYAAENGNGDTNGNTVHIGGEASGTEISFSVVAGKSQNGNASNNKIEVNNLSKIILKKDNAFLSDKNKFLRRIDIIGGEGSKIRFYEDASSEIPAATLDGNVVDFQGHMFEGLTLEGRFNIYGAFNRHGDTSNNTISMTNVKSITPQWLKGGKTDICSGYAGYGDSYFNTVNITGFGKEGFSASDVNIIGGYGRGMANSNEVHLSNAKYLGGGLVLVAGEVCREKSSASQNEVHIRGNEGQLEITGSVYAARNIETHKLGEAEEKALNANVLTLGSEGSSILIHGTGKNNTGTIIGADAGEAGTATNNLVSFAEDNKAQIQIEDAAMLIGGRGSSLEENKVEIKNMGGYIKGDAKLYGAMAHKDDGEVISNSVNLSGDSFVIEGNAEIAGALGGADTVKNTVNLDGIQYLQGNAKVSGAIGSKKVHQNAVNFTNFGTGANITGTILGAEGEHGASLIANSVNIKNIPAGANMKANLIGGYAKGNSGNLFENAVNLSAASEGISTISNDADIRGGYGEETANISDNHVNLHNFSLIAKDAKIMGAYGMILPLGEGGGERNNGIKITSDGKHIDIRGKLYGGYGSSQTAYNFVEAENVQTISKDARIYGGHSKGYDVIGNFVEITGKTKLGVKGSIYGGHSLGEENVTAKYNKISLHKLESLSGELIAGSAKATEKGIASNNKVFLEGISKGASISGSIAAGVSTLEGNENTVSLTKINTISEDASIYAAGDGYLLNTAKENELSIEMTGTDRSISGNIYAGRAKEEAKENKISISNVLSLDAKVVAGDSEGIASGNTLSILGDEESGVDVSTSLYAGHGGKTANENILTLKNIRSTDSEIIAGRGEKKTANRNILTVIGLEGQAAELDGALYGGYGKTEASHNKIYLENVAVTDNIIAGRASKKSEKGAQNNEVFLAGYSDFEEAAILGGAFAGNFKGKDGGALFNTGNILHIGKTASGRKAWTSPNPQGNVVAGIENFESIKFYEIIGAKDKPALKILNKSDLSQTTIDATSISFKDEAELEAFLKSKDAKVILIDTNGNDDGIVGTKIQSGKYTIGTTSEGQDGVALLEGTNVVYRIGDVEGSGGSGGSEAAGGEGGSGDSGSGDSGSGGSDDSGSQGGSGDSGGSTDSGASDSKTPTPKPQKPRRAVAQTHNTVVGQSSAIVAITSAQEDAKNLLSKGMKEGMTREWTGFFSNSVSKETYRTGSHIDTKLWNTSIGIGKALTKEVAAMFVFEHGAGRYKTFNARGREGQGDLQYNGLAAALRYDNNKSYGSIGLQLGRVKNDAKDVLTDGTGTRYDYKTSGNYYGAFLELGKHFQLTETTLLDLYAEYRFNSLEKTHFKAGGDYKLDAVHSSILGTGLRLSHAFSAWNLHYGLGLEQEFDGRAEGTADHLEIKAADISGTSVSGNLGLSYARKDSPWSFDMGISGYAGKHRGVRGNLGLGYKF